VAPPRDPQALAKAIVRLIGMERTGRQQLGAKARNRIETQFSLPAIVQRYEELYRALELNPSP
jgi:glycosyltransferase involved in cell wall biosynthesis